MRLASTLRYLTLPAATVLVVALAVACSEGIATGPDQNPLQPDFKKGKPTGNHPKLDDTDGACTLTGYVLKEVNPGASVDDDEDGLICVYQK